jgi:iron complex outermembrane receptor protein
VVTAAGPSPAAAQAPEGFFTEARDYFKSETVEGVSKHAETPAEAPATVTVVGREEIERYGFRTVADVLDFASVGNATLGDRRWDLAASRGVFLFEDYNTRILVMLDGHVVNEPWSNFADLGRAMLVPLDLVERVEIVYGPSAVLYGGYSLYGIVNVVTRPAGSLAGFRARASAGSWRTGEAVVSWARAGTYGGGEDGTSRDWSVLVAAGGYDTDGEDFDVPRQDVGRPVRLDGSTEYGGPDEGSDFERAPFAYLRAQRGGLGLLARWGYRLRGTPFAPYGALYNSREQSLRDEKAFLEARWERPLTPRTTLQVRGFHDLYAYDERDPYPAGAAHPGEQGYRFLLEASNHDTGGEVRLVSRRGTHFLTAGAEYRHRTLARTSFTELFSGAVVSSTRLSQETSGRFAVVYAQDEWRPNDLLSLVVGGSWARTTPGGTRTQPRLAAIVKPRRGLAVKALYAQGFRPPSIYEATYADYEGNLPNPALRSEEIASIELAVLWSPSPGLSLQAYTFRSTLEGLIGPTLITSPSDAQGGVAVPGGTPADLVGQFQYQSTGEVRSKGAGASARLQGRRLHAYANAAYARGERQRPGAAPSALASASRWLATGGLSWQARDWTASISGQYVGPHDLDPARGGGRAGDYVVANVRLVHRTRVVYPLALHLDVFNVFDGQGTFAASPVFTPARLPIPGRRVLFGAEVRF